MVSEATFLPNEVKLLAPGLAFSYQIFCSDLDRVFPKHRLRERRDLVAGAGSYN